MTDFTPPRRLTAEDDADGFDCGLPVVNDWLRNQLRNAGKQHTAVAYATFYDGAPAGFYTLSAYSIGHAEANGWLRRNSPDPIPAILLGMLGVAMRYQTMHVGAQLLRDATMRAMGAAEIVGAKALLVEPASDRATRFYEHYNDRAGCSSRSVRRERGRSPWDEGGGEGRWNGPPRLLVFSRAVFVGPPFISLAGALCRPSRIGRAVRWRCRYWPGLR